MSSKTYWHLTFWVCYLPLVFVQRFAQQSLQLTVCFHMRQGFDTRIILIMLNHHIIIVPIDLLVIFNFICTMFFTPGIINLPIRMLKIQDSANDTSCGLFRPLKFHPWCIATHNLHFSLFYPTRLNFCFQVPVFTMSFITNGFAEIYINLI